VTTILTKKKDTSGAPSASDLTNSTGGAELAVNTADKRLYTKDSGGNVVEVGTNPSTLNVNGNVTVETASDPAQITLRHTGNTSGLVLKNFSGDEAQLVNVDNGPMVFKTNDTERMRIDSSGNVVIGSGGLDVSGIGGTYTALNMRAGGGYPVLYGQTTATTTNSAAMQIVGATSGASAGGAAEMLGVIQIAAESDSSTNATGYINFYTGSGGSVAERMRITSAGDVGIGTSSPAAKLDIVEATSTTAVKIKSGTSTNQNTHITMFNDNDGGTLSLGVFGSSATTFGTITATDGFITANQELCLNSQNASGAIKFGVGSTPTEAMRIDSSGQVGIGTSSPGTTLDVNGTIKHAGPSTSDFAQSGYVSGQTISVTAPSTTEGAVYHVIATRHTGVGIRILEVGYVLYSANGVGAYTQQIAGSGISISVSGSTISNTNTGSTATIHLRINRI